MASRAERGGRRRHRRNSRTRKWPLAEEEEEQEKRGAAARACDVTRAPCVEDGGLRGPIPAAFWSQRRRGVPALGEAASRGFPSRARSDCPGREAAGESAAALLPLGLPHPPLGRPPPPPPPAVDTTPLRGRLGRLGGARSLPLEAGRGESRGGVRPAREGGLEGGLDG